MAFSTFWSVTQLQLINPAESCPVREDHMHIHFFSLVTQNFNLVHSVVMLIIKAKKGVLYHNKGLFIKCMRDLFTAFFFQKDGNIL
jgi:hypothetical protein